MKSSPCSWFHTFAWLVIALMIVVLMIALSACQDLALPTAASLVQADRRADDIGQKVATAATQVSGSAGEIVTAARDGRTATPPAVRPTLDPFWTRIIANGQLLLAQGDALAGVRRDIDTLRSDVQAGKRQLDQALTDLSAEKQGRQQDNTAWQKKLDSANSKWERMFLTVSWLAMAAIGVSVAVGFLLHDFRISIAGGAGGMAVVVACMIVGQIQHWLPWVAGGLLAMVAVWVLVETYLRGSFTAAIRTNPVQDVRDLLNPPASAPATPTAPS